MTVKTRIFAVSALCLTSFTLLSNFASAHGCEPHSASKLPIHALANQSSDPLLQLISNSDESVAKAVMARPLADLIADPLLTRIAYTSLCEPSKTQTAAFRQTLGADAFNFIALIKKIDLAPETDLLLQGVLDATSWTDGFNEGAARIYESIKSSSISQLMDDKQYAELESLQLVASHLQQAEQYVRFTVSITYAVSTMLPAYLPIVTVCKAEQLKATPKRAALCKAVGVSMERYANTYISINIRLPDPDQGFALLSGNGVGTYLLRCVNSLVA